MKNLSHTNKISFAWATTQILGGGRITFAPHSGIVEPQVCEYHHHIYIILRKRLNFLTSFNL